MTYVLVHGGGSTARFWDRLRPLLDRPSVAVHLPGRADRPADLATLTPDAAAESATVDVVEAAPEGPLTVLAHSSGGLVVPALVERLGVRVRHVILNAALVPPEGGTGLECMRPGHRDALVAAVEQAREAGITITMPGPPEDGESWREAYGGESLDDDTLAFMLDPERSVPDSVHPYFQPVRWSRAGGVPVTYVVNERDRPVRPELQEEMAARLPGPCRVVRFDAGHIPAVTHPRAFARAVVEADAAQAAAGRSSVSRA